MAETIVKPTVNTTIPTTPAPVVPQAPAVVVIKTEQATPQLESKEAPEPQVAGDMTIPTDPYYTDPTFYEVANFFGLEQEEYAAAKYKLSDIVDYAIKEGKSNKPEHILMQLRKIEDKLQRPAWGEKRYTNVYKYIRLAAKQHSIGQAMSAFERGKAFDYGN